MIVDAKRSYGPRYMGHDNHRNLKSIISGIIKKNEYCRIIADEPDKLYTCSIHIKNEAKKKMTEEEQQQVYISVRNDIWKVFGQDGLFIAMAHNCMEVRGHTRARTCTYTQVMHKEISKAKAIEVILTSYRRVYDIVGMCMCGDAENDKVALNYMSRMAEVSTRLCSSARNNTTLHTGARRTFARVHTIECATCRQHIGARGLEEP